MSSAFGIGVRRQKNGITLDVHFGHLSYPADTSRLGAFFKPGIQRLSSEDVAQLAELLPELGPLTQFKPDPTVYQTMDIISVGLPQIDTPIESAEDAYLKLHLLSARHIQPHGANLDGLFGKLANVAWSNKGPILPEDVTGEALNWIGSAAPLQVTHVDKFPYLVNYMVPTGVRIASGSQVRLGAHLGDGTTVMPAGYINFNAGTLGHAMVEGRISAGVQVGADSDLGGGSSIMGTLSGGGKEVISVGANCLIGANAGTGISLGDGCTIAAGLYITSGTKISLYNSENQPVDADNQPVDLGKNVIKARALSGRDGLLFYQDSVSGQIVAKPNPKLIELNAALHQNN